MKSILIGSVMMVLGLGFYFTPTETKSCHDVGFQLEDKLMNLSSSSKISGEDLKRPVDWLKQLHTHTDSKRSWTNDLVHALTP